MNPKLRGRVTKSRASTETTSTALPSDLARARLPLFVNPLALVFTRSELSDADGFGSGVPPRRLFVPLPTVSFALVAFPPSEAGRAKDLIFRPRVPSGVVPSGLWLLDNECCWTNSSMTSLPEPRSSVPIGNADFAANSLLNLTLASFVIGSKASPLNDLNGFLSRGGQ